MDMTHASRMIFAPLLLLAACQQAPDQRRDEQDGDSISSPIVDDGGPTATEDEAGNQSAARDGAPSGGEAGPIPQAFQGRWGLVAADCGPDKAAAKGLLTITGGMLRFYESVAKPANLSRPAPERLEGRFSFTGEGMEWSKDMSLGLRDNGATLVRTESDPVASYTYRRCAA